MADISKITIQSGTYNIKDQVARMSLTFNNVNEMKTSTDLIDGTLVRTSGFYSYNDGGGAYYKIRTKEQNETANEMNLIAVYDTSLIAELIYENDCINPKSLGAKLDGTTDDTDIIEFGLSLGDIKFPDNATVLISEMVIPQYRTIDFNYAEINCSGNAITMGSSSAETYTRDIVIKNAHFNNTATSSVDYTHKIIYMSQCIRCKLENITCSHILDGVCGIYIENCFNVNINGVYLGNGNAGKTLHSAGIILNAVTPSVAGTNNLTNISIEHGLIQNVINGIDYKITNGSIDTSTIDDIGISNCDNGYVIEGSSTTNKNIMISNSRAEGCGIGVYNFGSTTLNNVNINFLNKTDAIGIYNRASGRLTVQGYIGFVGTSTSMINQSGAWADFSNSYVSVNPATAPASLQSPIVRPLHIESSTHSGTDFSGFVHPFYDYQFVQTDSYTSSNLPSGMQNGGKLIICYNNEVKTCIYQNNTWNIG